MVYSTLSLQSLGSERCVEVLNGVTLNWPETDLGRRFVRSLKDGDFYLSQKFKGLLEQDALLAEEKTLGVVEGEAIEVDMRFSLHWSALHFGSVINTPLSGLVKISEALKFPQGSHIVDIGSGHGAPGFVFGALNPEVNFTGFEIVPSKVFYSNERAKDFGLSNVKFVEQDLGGRDFELPLADYYYLFNPVSSSVLSRLIFQIHAMATHLNSNIKVITYYNEGVVDTFLGAGFRVISYDEESKMYELSL